MPYTVVRGYFHLFYKAKRHVGSQPDGDSVWFSPNKPELLEELEGRNAGFNDGGFVQLRFEAVDSLELHFKGMHQHTKHAYTARDFTLGKVGFDTAKTVYSGETQMSVREASPHPIEGYILTRAIDPYGRPVAFVFTGVPAKKDGEQLFLDCPLFDKSVNAHLVKAGNAFPAFYTGLPTDLRERVTAAVRSARKRRLGLWVDDKTNRGASVGCPDDLELYALFPKLFRRLVSYFKSGDATLKKFTAWLREDEERDDKLWIKSIGEMANMHDVIKITGTTIAMKYKPEDLIIVPR